MSSITGFYGLQKLAAGDALSVSDYAFTNRNMDVIDRLLNKFDNALFSGGSVIDDPSSGPSLDVLTTGGVIPAGRTVRYKFTWVDSWGNETAASPETSITTPPPVARPSQPGSAYLSSGGTLLAGNYFYILSAYVVVNTSETNGSLAASLNIPMGSTNRVVLTLPGLPTGADGFNVYRRGPGETQFYYLASINMMIATPPSTYTDDNSITVSNSRTPSATNLTYSTNIVTVTVPGATPTVPDGYTWKVYRSFISGEWDSSLLNWVRDETYTGSGVTTPSVYDYGAHSTVGRPPTLTAITSSVSTVSTLQTSVNAIISELGSVPQGSYSTVSSRLAYEHNPNLTGFVSVLPSDVTNASTTLASAWTINGIRKVGQNGADFIFDLQLFFLASVAEGFQFSITCLTDQATPVVPGTFRYTVTPTSLVTGGADGYVYGSGDVVTLVGSSSIRSVRINGSTSQVGSALYPIDFKVYFAAASSVATPAGAELNANSYIRLTSGNISY